MVRGASRAPRVVRAAFVLALASGCGAVDPLGRAGVEFRPPSEWKSVPAETWPVPGRAIAAWSGPESSSLVVYQTLAIPGGRAGALAEGLANRLTGLPGVRVLSRGTETVSGFEAAKVEAVGQGTGSGLAPSGTGTPIAAPGTTLVPTRRVVYVVPRAGDTLTVVWHAPEANAAALESHLKSALAALRIRGRGLTTSTY